VNAEVVNGHYAWVIQRRGRFRLQLEAPKTLDVSGKRRREDFDRDISSESRIAGAIDLAHSARTEQAINLVGA
jgi:hypothetical protein